MKRCNLFFKVPMPPFNIVLVLGVLFITEQHIFYILSGYLRGRQCLSLCGCPISNIFKVINDVLRYLEEKICRLFQIISKVFMIFCAAINLKKYFKSKFRVYSMFMLNFTSSNFLINTQKMEKNTFAVGWLEYCFLPSFNP